MKILAFISGTLALTLACGRADQPSDQYPSAQQARAVAAEGVPEAFTRLIEEARTNGWSDLPIGEIVVLVGEHFLGAPYEAGMLDRGTVEELVVELDSFDCVLLVETALAAARAIRDGAYRYDNFKANLKEMRYRGGELDGYCSRLHYFSEWIADNEEKGLVRNVTLQIGGVRLDKTLSFMSRHRKSYPRFATNDSLFVGVEEMEKDLAGMEIYHIPQERISQSYDGIRHGDIIATSTRVDGLDVSHTGIAYRDGESVGFLHASTEGGVKVSPDLQEYVQNNDIQIGIVVARPL